MSSVGPEDLARIDALQASYISALDSKKLDGWLATFSSEPDTSYVLTTAENADAKHGIALILDDCRGRLEDRVTIINRVWRGTYQDYRTRHFVQRTGCALNAGGEVEVTSNFSVMFTPEDTGRTELFTAGVYVDRIVLGTEKLVFRSKVAITDSSLMARYLVYPI